jgi:catechol 2,3-dioxygenase-like lactoylglutathione lyase family enzyme
MSWTDNIHFLIPMAHVTDVQRSLDFYAKLGFEPVSVGKGDDGDVYWAHAKSGKAHMMFALDPESAKVDKESTVVMYMYAEDIVKLREDLLAKGMPVSEISKPFYMPNGEICLNDPDGYVILIGQSD